MKLEESTSDHDFEVVKVIEVRHGLIICHRLMFTCAVSWKC